MISVAEATDRLLALASPLGSETVPLRCANGRVTACPIAARHAQPPFSASAMDGYAVAGGPPDIGTTFRRIGESAAGHPFEGGVGPGDAVRIFTGGAIPSGATRVVIQEETAVEGGIVRIERAPGPDTYIRAAGGDFGRDFVLPAGTRLRSRTIALLAAMGHGSVAVIRRPDVAVLMTGDELRAPGEKLGPGQIVGSNGYGLVAMLEDAGAAPRLLPIARDRPDSLSMAFDLAGGADLLVTVGGASVGDHDIVASTAGSTGLELTFHTVAMRPGKPLLAGRMGTMSVLGLPGNPVSAMVCGVIFMLPMIRALLGLDPALAMRAVPAGAAIPSNDGFRAHYMRGRIVDGRAYPDGRQDSSLLSVLSTADVLLVRAAGAGAVPPGALVDVIDLPA